MVLRRAIAADFANAAAHLNLGNALADLDDLAGAEAAIHQAIALDSMLEAQVSLGFILTSRARLDEAIAACEAAIVMQPDFAQAHWNLAVAALLAGDYARRNSPNTNGASGNISTISSTCLARSGAATIRRGEPSWCTPSRGLAIPSNSPAICR